MSDPQQPGGADDDAGRDVPTPADPATPEGGFARTDDDDAGDVDPPADDLARAPDQG